MNSKSPAYFELIRLPNLFTAMADPLAGFLLVGGSWRDAGIWLPLCIASACLYAGGTTLNDVCDAAKDLNERPMRPIPSGRVSRRRVMFLGVLLLAGGTLAAFGASLSSGMVGIALAVAIVLYDGPLKTTPAAPVLMGTCRALNLSMGPLAGASLGDLSWRQFVAIALVWLYVTSITVFARREAHTGQGARILIGFAGVVLAAIGCMGLVLVSNHRIAAGAFGLVAVVVVLVAGYPAIRGAAPSDVQRAVKWFVINIIIIDACLAASGAGLPAGLMVAALMVPTVTAGRVFRVT